MLLRWLGLSAPLVTGTQYAVRIPSGGLMDGNTLDRAEQEHRLALCKRIWPDAKIVKRNIYYGEWKETS